MEDYSIDNFTLYDDSTYEDNTDDRDYIDYYGTMYYNNTPLFIQFVATCIIICVSLPLTLVAVYALYRLRRNYYVGPIYVISLLISNLIHLCCLIIHVARPVIWSVSLIVQLIYNWSLVANVCLMVCVALERYLIIAYPLLNSSRQNIRISVVVCFVACILAVVFVLLILGVDIRHLLTIFGVLFLLPFPLFIFFLGGTLKALSASRVPSDEKRRIVGILVLLLFIYMLLFLPFTICLLAEESINNNTLWILFEMFLRLSPLADLTLYFFMKKGTIDKFLSSVCCCRMDSSDISSSPV